MSDQRPRPLRLPAIAPVASIGAILLMLAGILIALYEEQVFQTQRLDQAREQAQILAASVSAAVAFDDRKAAQEYVRPMMVNPGLEAVGVYASRGPLLAGFVRKGVAPIPAHAMSAPSSFGYNHIIVTVPIVQERTTEGVVYLRTAPQPTLGRLARFAAPTLLVLMAVVLVVVLGNAQSRLSSQAKRLELANEQLQAEMSARSKAEEALRQSQKMEAIGQLSGGIAHDFNNLLTIIKGNLHRLKRRLAEDENAKYVDAAIEGADRAASLTRRILAFSRAQSLSPTRLDLNSLICGMKDLILSSVGENIVVEYDLKALWWTLCEQGQLETVLLNLVINARDAMPDGGKIRIETRDAEIAGYGPGMGDVAAGDYVALAVHDDGTGMSDDVRSKAFDPFFTTKPPGQGTGLGLSMSFGFIRQSGGFITIDSAPGKGTTITIHLPRAHATDEAGAGTLRAGSG
jgi:signal transduction histidine kinase